MTNVGAQEEHDRIAWLIQEGVMLLFEWCEPLAAKGHGDSVAHFLGWSLLVLEGIDNLSTAKVIIRRAIGVCMSGMVKTSRVLIVAISKPRKVFSRRLGA